MIFTGLVSVTFRKLSPSDIIGLVARAGLEGIEWGGDIHVPHGDVRRAREVYKMTVDTGLKVASYGSYYNAGCEERDRLSFERVLETAVELHAPTIRVWAGDRGSVDADEAWWNKVIGESVRIASLAQKAGITVSFEYHSDTLTDSSESANRLLKEINHDNIRSFWQPPIGLDVESCLSGLKQIAPWLGNIHVYTWKDYDRKPLSDGAEEWERYIAFLKTTKFNHFCLLEFVKDESKEQFKEDAVELRRLIGV